MPDTALLWKKHDEHNKRLGDLETTAKVHQERLDRHTQEFRTMNNESTARHTELTTTLSKYSEDMQELVKIHHEQRGELLGATRVGKWGIGIILSLATLVIAYIAATS